MGVFVSLFVSLFARLSVCAWMCACKNLRMTLVMDIQLFC